MLKTMATSTVGWLSALVAAAASVVCAQAAVIQPQLSLKQTLPSYCTMDSMQPTQLMALANFSATPQFSTVAEQQPVSQQAPSVRLGIVTYASKDIWNYAAYAMAINAAYAEHHGYSLTILDETSGAFDSGDARWNKVKILESALDPSEGWAQDLDFLVWIDADFVFLDFGFRLESVVGEAANPNAHLFISAEHAGSSTLINSGCVIVRNSPWTRAFLSEWWGLEDRALFSDQEQFDLLYEKRRRAALLGGGSERSFTQHIAILPPDKINSDPPAMVQQKPHNQVLHLMGEETHYRVRVFKEGLNELCRHHFAHHPSMSVPTASVEVDAEGTARQADARSLSTALAPQLTLTQANLLRWAVEEYSGHSRQLLTAYESQLPSVAALAPSFSGPAVPLTPQGLQVTRTLANSVHHFAHANLHYAEQRRGVLEGSEEGVEGERAAAEDTRRRDSIVLRKKVYQLLRRNLVVWKKLKAVTPGPFTASQKVDKEDQPVTFEAIRADWPELLKISAIAGQHLLSVTDSSLVSMRERRLVAGEILSMMEEMVAESHAAQHDAILLMVADTHSQIGMLDLSEANAGVSTSEGEDTQQEQDGARAEHFLRAALQHFQLSLDVTQRVAEKSGRHLLVAPLTLTANALSSLGRFDEALGMYEMAISLNEAHFGPTHASKVPLLVDFGISLMHASQSQSNTAERQGLCEKALSVLSAARQLIDSGGGDEGQAGAVSQRVNTYLQSAELRCGGI